MKNFICFIKGFITGSISTVPGLSGNIYYSSLNKKRGNTSAVTDIKENDRTGLFAVFLGALGGILIFCGIILWLCINYTAPSYSLFTGFILGAFPCIIYNCRKVRINPFYVFIGVSTFLITLFIYIFSLNGFSFMDITESLNIVSFSIYPHINLKNIIIVFIIGAVAFSFIKFPIIGISSLLVVSNKIGEIYYSVTNIFKSSNAFIISLVFLAGALLGGVYFSKIIDSLFKKYTVLSFYCLGGFLSGLVLCIFHNGILDSFLTNGFNNRIAQVIIYMGFVLLGFLISRKINSD